MKQLYFVFAATAGIILFAAPCADAATRYTSSGVKRSELYQSYTGCAYAGCTETLQPLPAVVVVQEKKQETVVRRSEPRNPNKTVLADPFFQPLSGHVMSLTDVGYARNTYDFDIVYGTGSWGGITGDWKADEIFVKEDLSVGISDDVAILGMLKYAHSKYQMDWNPFYDNTNTYHPATSDRMKDNGIAIWGLGLQWKVHDDSKWVANLGAFFQSADVANNLMLTGKAGYKLNSDATIYGLANLAYIMWENPSYGNGISNSAGQTAFIAFNSDAKRSFYLEGGLGVFYKLSDQWSVNLEGLAGKYDWHAQVFAKAMLSWQPVDNFALGLYGKASLLDTADSAKDLRIYSWDATTPAAFFGCVKLSHYQDLQAGLIATIYF